MSIFDPKPKESDLMGLETPTLVSFINGNSGKSTRSARSDHSHKLDLRNDGTGRIYYLPTGFQAVKATSNQTLGALANVNGLGALSASCMVGDIIEIHLKARLKMLAAGGSARIYCNVEGVNKTERITVNDARTVNDDSTYSATWIHTSTITGAVPIAIKCDSNGGNWVTSDVTDWQVILKVNGIR